MGIFCFSSRVTATQLSKVLKVFLWPHQKRAQPQRHPFFLPLAMVEPSKVLVIWLTVPVPRPHLRGFHLQRLPLLQVSRKSFYVFGNAASACFYFTFIFTVDFQSWSYPVLNVIQCFIWSDSPLSLLNGPYTPSDCFCMRVKWSKRKWRLHPSAPLLHLLVAAGEMK